MNRKEMFEVADKITDIVKRKVLESIEYDKKDVYSNGIFNGRGEVGDELYVRRREKLSGM